MLFSIVICAQTPPAIQWQKSFGGSNNETAYSIQQTTDGGYIVAGMSYSNDGNVTGNHDTTGNTTDYWVVKLDSIGNIQWQKSLGGSRNDEAYSIQQTTDGGYIVAGYTASNDGNITGYHGSYDYWIVKIDSLGNIQWQKCYGGCNSDVAYSVQQTNDGGYVVAGYSISNDGDVTGIHGYEDYWIVKLDSIGNIQWQKCLGGSRNDEAHSIQQTNDGGYIIAGFSNNVTGNHDISGSTYDYWIVKIDSLGNIQWQKHLGGTNEDKAYSIKQTNDGGYIVAGTSTSIDGDVTGHHGNTGFFMYDYWIVKLDSIGNIQWQKCLGGSRNDEAHSIQQTNDGGYIVAGTSQSNNGDVTGNHAEDNWIVKLDSSGNLQWQKCLGGSSAEEAYSIQQTFDGGYIVAGYSYSNDGDVSGNHGTSGNSGNPDYWIVKLSSDKNGIEVQTITNEVAIYPNPTKETLNITNAEKGDIHIYNVLGEEVMNAKCNEGGTINVSSLAVGTYILKVVSAKGVVVRKLIIND